MQILPVVIALALVALASPTVSAGALVYVADVEQLYATVNDTANEGAVVVLAPGIYPLSPTDPAGSARANGGRLELQKDMSLYGVAGDRAAVVIDAGGLPSSSFTSGLPAGRGSNTIEWLTVLGKPAAAAGIETDLPGTSSTRIRVAHVVGNGSSRGVFSHVAEVSEHGRSP